MANKDSEKQPTNDNNNVNTITVINSSQSKQDFLVGETLVYILVGENKNIPSAIQENKLFQFKVVQGKYKVVS